MNTIIYLIRHSVRLNKDFINEYITTQDKLVLSEKIILNSEGEKRAEILSNESELQNLDYIYSSNCVRTLQTAKYIMEKQQLNVSIDDRFDERRVGKPNDDVVTDWFVRQFVVPSYKTEGGESQIDVRSRMDEAISEILDLHKGKRIAIFSHGYAMTFYLLKWCKFEYMNEKDNIKLTFKDNVIFNKKMNAPEVFKLTFDENKDIINIENIEFDDLPYKDGLGK